MAENHTQNPGSLDVYEPDAVDIHISKDGKTVWVNTKVCRLRISKIKGSVSVHDLRPSERPKRRK